MHSTYVVAAKVDLVDADAQKTVANAGNVRSRRTHIHIGSGTVPNRVAEKGYGVSEKARRREGEKAKRRKGKKTKRQERKLLKK